MYVVYNLDHVTFSNCEPVILVNNIHIYILYNMSYPSDCYILISEMKMPALLQLESVLWRLSRMASKAASTVRYVVEGGFRWCRCGRWACNVCN